MFLLFKSVFYGKNIKIISGKFLFFSEKKEFPFVGLAILVLAL